MLIRRFHRFLPGSPNDVDESDDDDGKDDDGVDESNDDDGDDGDDEEEEEDDVDDDNGLLEMFSGLMDLHAMSHEHLETLPFLRYLRNVSPVSFTLAFGW